MAIAVTDKIKQIIAARDRKILSGSAALQALLDELKKELLAELAVVPSDSFSAFHLKQSLNALERHIADFSLAAQRETGSLISSAWDQGAGLLPAAAHAAGQSAIEVGISGISSGVIQTLQEFTAGRMRSISSDLFTRIQGELTLGILGQKTPQQVASFISGSISSPSIFKSVAERAEVVVQLEMGRAFSIATEKTIAAAQETLPELKSMWIHAGHPRAPRLPHLLMHGQVRAPGKPFFQAKDGTPVHFPRDPKAPISEIIRCGCIHIPWMAAWGTAREFAASWDQTQYEVNHKQAA